MDGMCRDLGHTCFTRVFLPGSGDRPWVAVEGAHCPNKQVCHPRARCTCLQSRLQRQVCSDQQPTIVKAASLAWTQRGESPEGRFPHRVGGGDNESEWGRVSWSVGIRAPGREGMWWCKPVLISSCSVRDIICQIAQDSLGDSAYCPPPAAPGACCVIARV
jgi:hypothetical protein